MKRSIRHLTDLGMTLLLLGLMSYSITNQAVHEWMGVAAFFLFLLHHLLNWRWIRSLRKGRYTPVRVIQTTLVFLLLASMLAQIVSGIAMSRHALPFLDIPLPTSRARLIHLACGYWSFLLISVHLGFHCKKLFASRTVLRIIIGAAAFYGAVCFIQQDIVNYLFLRTEFAFFDYEKSPLLALGELAAMMTLWVLVGYLLQRLSVRQTKRGEKK